jgi:chromosome segregation protein
LGEQSPKHLRGAAMSDVIFAGSTSRKPIGRCEVSLIFDNNLGLCPEKYRDIPEIEITRRLYRSGESEYLVNGLASRLLDIRELVMDTGIAGRAYSIVEQGRVEQFISASPQERRLFVEEAAGIVRYRTRRIAAEKKLEQTDQNLVRINDLLGELRRQEGALGGQVEKAREFIALRDEVGRLSAEWNRARLRRGEKECARLEQMKVEVAAALAKHVQGVQLHEADWERLQGDQTVAEGQLTAARAAFYERQRDAAAADGRLALERQNLDHTTQWISGVEQRLAEIKGRREASEAQRTTGAREITSLSAEETGLREAVNGGQAALSEKEAAARAIEHEQQTLQEQLMECHTETSGIVNRRRSIAERSEDWTRRAEALDKQIRGTRTEQGAAAESLTELTTRLTGLRQSVSESEVTSQNVSAVLSEGERARGERKVRMDSAERDERECRSRLAALTEIEASHEGLDEPVRQLLDWADSRPGGRESLGLVGPLAEFLSVPPGVLDWAAPFLAPYLELVIVRRSGQIGALETAVRERNLGRVKFIPLDAAAAAAPVALPQLGEPFAAQVALPPELAPLREALFAGARVLPPGSEPYPLPQGGGACAQWLEGAGRFALEHTGAISLGQAAPGAAGVLRRRMEMQSQQTRLATLSALLEAVRAEAAGADAETALLAERERALRQGLQEQTLQLKSAEQEHGHQEREAARIKLALEHLDSDRRQLEQDLLNARAQEQELAVSATAWEQKRGALEAGLVSIRERVTAARTELSAVGTRLTESKVKLERTTSSLEHLRAQQANLEKEAAESEARLAEGAQQHEQKRAALRQIRETIDALTAQLAGLQQQQQVDQAEVNRLATVFEQGEVHRLAALTRSKALQQARDQAQTRLHEVDTALAVERTKLAQAIEQLGEAPPPDPELAELDEPELEKRLKTGQSRLDKLGGVNLAAPEEFAQLQARIAFLEAQKADLEKACEDLKQSIRKMNSESRKRFKETFDRVNETFQRMFPDVFGGGEARLVLTDSEDLLLAGVDIVAQPPGKKLQNLGLLSGGEKALTAIALIFSFFLIKPSPFCLLDEVDAPLDDANVGRFNRLVQGMTDRTQFIIITHNRRTMESGDLLFGVTMEEAGVSKVVSVNLSSRPA